MFFYKSLYLKQTIQGVHIKGFLKNWTSDKRNPQKSVLIVFRVIYLFEGLLDFYFIILLFQGRIVFLI